MVPTGTFRTMLSPSRPVQLEPSPWRPRSPLYSGLKRKWTSVLWRSLDSITMSPPRPPSPPEGPPRGTNFSRRKAMHPLPPSPPLILMIASSINMLSILIVQAREGIRRQVQSQHRSGHISQGLSVTSSVGSWQLDVYPPLRGSQLQF